MSQTNNSISDVLKEMVRISNNNFNLLNSLNFAFNSNLENVEVSYFDQFDNLIKFKVPGFNFLKNEIKRIDDILNKLQGKDSRVFLRNSDGTTSQVFKYSLNSQIPVLNNLGVPKFFSTKNNFIFDNFLSPQIVVKVDVNKFLNSNGFVGFFKTILVRKIILDLNNDSKLNWFENNIKNRSDIDFADLLKQIVENGVEIVFDDEMQRIEPSVFKFFGSFDVIDIKTVDAVVDGQNTKKKKYILNSLKYSNVENSFRNSETLKIGDRLIYKNSIFLIEGVDLSDNGVFLKQISGIDVIKISSQELFIFSSDIINQNLEISILPDSYYVVFLKVVDDFFNLTSNDWSSGFAFYSNELKSENGLIGLNDFYLENVADVGQMLKGLVKERHIPAYLGIKPDPPVLKEENFKVVQINKHKTDSNLVESIKNKIAEKIKLETEINNLIGEINLKKLKLFTDSNLTQNEIKNLNSEINDLISKKETKSNLFVSIVKELSVLKNSNPQLFEAPKYRIRGFFEIPEPKFDSRTGNQNVIKFIIEYRYLKKDGSSVNPEQFQINTTNGDNQVATFSNWNVIETPIRKKVFNEKLGIFEWDVEDVQNPDVVNINQVDIPISKNEIVEFRVKSVSEAGFPFNPLTSDYSNSIKIEFPSELESTNSIADLLSNIDVESTKADFRKELSAVGLDVHLSKSTFVGDKYFAHDSSQLASGFFDSSGKQMDVFTKLQDLQNQILNLKSILEKKKGLLKVVLVDENGTEYVVKNGSTVTLFAGFYKDEVQKLPTSERKGAIITKRYTLKLINIAQSILDFYSKFYGGIGQRLFNSIDPQGLFSNSVLFPNAFPWVNESIKSGDWDYNLYRRYDIVPINNLSVSTNETTLSSKISSQNLQSQQLRGQFVYLRYVKNSLNENENLYEEGYYLDSNNSKVNLKRTDGTDEMVIERCFLPTDPSITSGTQFPFVWNGSYTGSSPNGNGVVTDFCIHIDHPLLNDGSANSFNKLMYPSFQIEGWFEDKIFGKIPKVSAPEVYPAFYHSKYFNLYQGSKYFGMNGVESVELVSNNDFLKQLNYRNNFVEYGENKWVALLNLITSSSNTSLNQFQFPILVDVANNPVLSNYNFYNGNSLATKFFPYPNKMGFFDYDRYLIGKNTCGCYLFLSPTTFDQVLVNGQDASAVRIFNQDDKIEIPIIFQYRMTDYFGPSNTGDGVVLGYNTQLSNQLTFDSNINVTYRKRIGIDIYVNSEDLPNGLFSFDLEVYAKLKNDSKGSQVDLIGSSVVIDRTNIQINKNDILNIN